MGRAIAIRRGYSSGDVRRIAQRVKNAGQARRLLAIAAVLDGATREEAATIGGMDRQTLRDWVIRLLSGSAFSLSSTLPKMIRSRHSEALLDHLRGKNPQGRRHGETKRPGGPQIDHQIEFDRLLHRKISWFVALQDAAGILTNLTVRQQDAGAIADQPTSVGKFVPRVRSRQGMTCGKCHNLSAPVRE